MTNLNERAAKALGWEIIEEEYGTIYIVERYPQGWYTWRTYFDPEHRIEHAWLLVEKCHELCYHVEINYWEDFIECGVYGEGNLRIGWATAKSIVAVTEACTQALESAK